MPLAMPFGEIVAINNKRGEQDLIRLVVDTDNPEYDPAEDDEEDATVRAQYILTDFAEAEAFESALGILEQMWEEAHEEGEEEEAEEEEEEGEGEGEGEEAEEGEGVVLEA
eukprot:SAG11_NODE_21863_length_417_cov_0.540881_1_plen_110_part_01